MKKRRTLIISMLLIAALCLGIGYAAVAATDTLKITGSASADGTEMNKQFDMDVYFSAAVPDDTNLEAEDATVTAEIITDAGRTDGYGDEATFEVAGLAVKGEYATVTYTITNDHDADVWVSLITPENASNDFIQIDHSLVKDRKIDKDGGTITFTVTAKLVALSDEDVSIDNYSLKIKVSTEAPAASN